MVYELTRNCCFCGKPIADEKPQTVSLAVVVILLLPVVVLMLVD